MFEMFRIFYYRLRKTGPKKLQGKNTGKSVKSDKNQK
jgi:hypothetical protein